MYRIVTSQSANGRRLISAEQLTRADFEQIAAELAAVPRDARKIGFIAVRRAVQSERIETLWNVRETVARAEPGDWIATNMGADRTPLRDAAGNLNVYVIGATRFPELYQSDGSSSPHGDIYRPRTVVRAIYLPSGFEIFAPWGKMQRADTGYLIDNGAEVYGNAKETFEKTYAWV